MGSVRCQPGTTSPAALIIIPPDGFAAAAMSKRVMRHVWQRRLARSRDNPVGIRRSRLDKRFSTYSLLPE